MDRTGKTASPRRKRRRSPTQATSRSLSHIYAHVHTYLSRDPPLRRPCNGSTTRRSSDWDHGASSTSLCPHSMQFSGTPHVLRKWQCLKPVVCNSHLQHNQLSTKVQPHVKQRETSDTSTIDPLRHPDFFQVHNLFTVKDLYDARVHYGHKETLLNEHMETFVFGSRLGHLIIDLDQTAELLRQALNFTAHIAFRDGIILFISRNPQVTHIVDKTAKVCKEFAHTRVWRHGLFPNSKNLYKTMTRLPDLIIFLNTLDTVMAEHTAVKHAAKMCIPTVGIVDTNCNPNLITYPVPGNDDSLCAIELYCSLFKEAILRGKRTREKLAKLAETM